MITSSGVAVAAALVISASPLIVDVEFMTVVALPERFEWVWTVFETMMLITANVPSEA